MRPLSRQPVRGPPLRISCPLARNLKADPLPTNCGVRIFQRWMGSGREALSPGHTLRSAEARSGREQAGSPEAQEVEKRKERPGRGRTSHLTPAPPAPLPPQPPYLAWDGDTQDWGGLGSPRHRTTEIHLLVKRKENKETRFLQRCYKKPLKKPF